MIVDDDIVIIGSANINDRSMMGTRDSEIAIKIRDYNLIKGKFNKKEVQVSKFAADLRRALYMEHLGTSTIQNVIDPLDSSFQEGMR